VYGQSGSTNSVTPTRDGVRGFTDNRSGSGVRGENFAGGTGVTGVGINKGTGVMGIAGAAGTGVYGTVGAVSSIGVLAENGAGGAALKVNGVAAFSRSGLLTVAAGGSSATVTGVGLTAASLVLATLQQHTAGVYVLGAVPDLSSSSFTIYLSKAPTASTKVAWFVVN
jgi:hypothetical protein